MVVVMTSVGRPAQTAASTLLISSSTNYSLVSPVQAWLNNELEQRGIDARIYTRYILSILQQDGSVAEDSPTQDRPVNDTRVRTLSGKQQQRHPYWWSASRNLAASQEELDKRRKAEAVDVLTKCADDKYRSGLVTLVDELLLKIEEQKITETESPRNCSITKTMEENRVVDGTPVERYCAAFPPLSEKYMELSLPLSRPLTSSVKWASVAKQSTVMNSNSPSKQDTVSLTRIQNSTTQQSQQPRNGTTPTGQARRTTATGNSSKQKSQSQAEGSVRESSTDRTASLKKQQKPAFVVPKVNSAKVQVTPASVKELSSRPAGGINNKSAKKKLLFNDDRNDTEGDSKTTSRVQDEHTDEQDKAIVQDTLEDYQESESHFPTLQVILQQPIDESVTRFLAHDHITTGPIYDEQFPTSSTDSELDGRRLYERTAGTSTVLINTADAAAHSAACKRAMVELQGILLIEGQKEVKPVAETRVKAIGEERKAQKMGLSNNNITVDSMETDEVVKPAAIEQKEREGTLKAESSAAEAQRKAISEEWRGKRITDKGKMRVQSEETHTAGSYTVDELVNPKCEKEESRLNCSNVGNCLNQLDEETCDGAQEKEKGLGSRESPAVHVVEMVYDMKKHAIVPKKSSLEEMVSESSDEEAVSECTDEEAVSESTVEEAVSDSIYEEAVSKLTYEESTDDEASEATDEESVLFVDAREQISWNNERKLAGVTLRNNSRSEEVVESEWSDGKETDATDSELQLKDDWLFPSIFVAQPVAGAGKITDGELHMDATTKEWVVSDNLLQCKSYWKNVAEILTTDVSGLWCNDVWSSCTTSRRTSFTLPRPPSRGEDLLMEGSTNQQDDEQSIESEGQNLWHAEPLLKQKGKFTLSRQNEYGYPQSSVLNAPSGKLESPIPIYSLNDRQPSMLSSKPKESEAKDGCMDVFDHGAGSIMKPLTVDIPANECIGITTPTYIRNELQAILANSKEKKHWLSPTAEQKEPAGWPKQAMRTDSAFNVEVKSEQKEGCVRKKDETSGSTKIYDTTQYDQISHYRGPLVAGTSVEVPWNMPFRGLAPPDAETGSGSLINLSTQLLKPSDDDTQQSMSAFMEPTGHRIHLPHENSAFSEKLVNKLGLAHSKSEPTLSSIPQQQALLQVKIGRPHILHQHGKHLEEVHVSSENLFSAISSPPLSPFESSLRTPTNTPHGSPVVSGAFADITSSNLVMKKLTELETYADDHTLVTQNDEIIAERLAHEVNGLMEDSFEGISRQEVLKVGTQPSPWKESSEPIYTDQSSDGKISETATRTNIWAFGGFLSDQATGLSQPYPSPVDSNLLNPAPQLICFESLIQSVDISTATSTSSSSALSTPPLIDGFSDDSAARYTSAATSPSYLVTSDSASPKTPPHYLSDKYSQKPPRKYWKELEDVRLQEEVVEQQQGLHMSNQNEVLVDETDQMSSSCCPLISHTPATTPPSSGSASPITPPHYHSDKYREKPLRKYWKELEDVRISNQNEGFVDDTDQMSSSYSYTSPATSPSSQMLPGYLVTLDSATPKTPPHYLGDKCREKPLGKYWKDLEDVHLQEEVVEPEQQQQGWLVSYRDEVFEMDDIDLLAAGGLVPPEQPTGNNVQYSDQLEMSWMNSNSGFQVQKPQKPPKGKLVPSMKLCTFFKEGNCHRAHCQFAHDTTKITCRFWENGSCHKGATCSFLHGYMQNRSMSEELANEWPPVPPVQFGDSDFPELSKSAQDELDEDTSHSKPPPTSQQKAGLKKTKKKKLNVAEPIAIPARRHRQKDNLPGPLKSSARTRSEEKKK